MSFTFEAKVRSDLGKGASRRLRHANKFPAVIYGQGEEAISIELEHDLINNAQSGNAEFFSSVITLVVDGTEMAVTVKAMQRHAFKPKLQHIDFIRA
ncbi:MAG: 50S ribosomal protein L25 [Moritella sp.]|uniref:50S ribosomal protein L25 n=1 Tax=Moritella sp. TaxID=78556 RepID=UPI0029BCC1AB|nr:50S ribosomal protein L25 [Moritella sp.]MDX2322144.1 50S ribosomal protein L25 [Moritella sp.]